MRRRKIDPRFLGLLLLFLVAAATGIIYQFAAGRKDADLFFPLGILRVSDFFL